MTSQMHAGSWEPVPGASSYAASTLGEVRSVDRMLADGRRRKGQPIRWRLSNSGYPIITLTFDDGAKHTVTLHSVILTTFDGPCPDGQTARHLDDNPLNNAWAPGETAPERIAAGGNLMWGTWPEQIADQYRNGSRQPAAPRPLKHCIICGDVFETPGRRCHDCLEKLGREAAALLAAGTPLARACEVLRYPSAEGLLRMASKHAGASPNTETLTDGHHRGWLRWLPRVTAALAVTFRHRSQRRGSHRA